MYIEIPGRLPKAVTTLTKGKTSDEVTEESGEKGPIIQIHPMFEKTIKEKKREITQTLQENSDNENNTAA